MRLTVSTILMILIAVPFSHATAQAKPKRPPAPEREWQFPLVDLETLEKAQHDLQHAMPQMESALLALELSLPDVQMASEDALRQAELALSNVDWNHLRDFRFDFDFDFDHDFDFDFDHDFDFDFDHDFDLDRNLPFDSEGSFRHNLRLSAGADAGARRESDLRSTPPEAWSPSDPADSIYRVAREALNRGEYRRAAQLFREIREKFVKSAYAADAFYWESFALYRIGGVEELRTAVASLDEQRARFASASTQADAAVLATRIRGALAARGDSRAASRVERDANGNGNGDCDKDDMTVRIEALSALEQMDPEAATPILRRVLSRRDACSEMLRRRAVFLVGKKAGADAAALLSEVARTDTNSDVRSDAIAWLARLPGDLSLGTLEGLLKGDHDDRVQRSAIRALAAHPSPRARESMKAIIERTDGSERMRSEAISYFGREGATQDHAAYLRALYVKLESQRLKEQTLSAVSRIGGETNQRWLLVLAANGDEPIQLRAAALSRVARMEVQIAEMVSLYDRLQERGLREHLIGVFGRRKEPEATNKLFDIARNGTDPQLRRTAISVLTKKDDPRTTRLLMEILDK
ncbi:MAG: HEAT repeat domain-containing protein [Gemmatimonadaceae bacterium]|nr:HEAT repeat domain-containing protein [Gemmatimonadaceae bacterium]